MMAKTFLVAAGVLLATYLDAFGQTKQTVYTNDFEGAFRSLPGLARGGTVGLTDTSGQLSVLSTNGQLLAEYSAAKPGAAPVLYGLQALPPVGSELWRYSSPEFAWLGLAIEDDGTVYVAAMYTDRTGISHSELRAYDPDGTQLWEFADNVLLSDPAITPNGNLVFSIGDSPSFVRAVTRNGQHAWTTRVSTGYLGTPATKFGARHRSIRLARRSRF